MARDPTAENVGNLLSDLSKEEFDGRDDPVCVEHAASAPDKAETSSAIALPPDPDDVRRTKNLVHSVSMFLARRVGPKWEATEGECENFAIDLIALAEKYAPVLRKWSLEIAVAANAGAYVIKRVGGEPEESESDAAQ